ncbi:alpha-1,2-fucosyltransferase [Leptospira ellisii]|uniref:Alpha-1,2-fucosyltransferase n=1 Tax=Leptospira ellisii TaxID=2023197 RepID=A0A2N0BJW0_9LEPT|nr:alpha-1,2-fucosyltransferase [Leptospira ellisii]MDV6236899.1 alpha-1,2-fucosyltransferase [Leptospira ellisii]PJZ92574.1 hypothetical protein CH379_12450 [Leptospira ellisii]PKA04260.1 hypothetical protein CH375_12075 [Leptospira ellisii]
MNKSVVADVYGGLGNQLFQYAMARNLADRLGGELYLDLSWFGISGEELVSANVTPRKFQLNFFETRFRNLTDEVRRRYSDYFGLYRKLLGRMGVPQKVTRFYEKKLFEFQKLPNTKKSEILLVGGYWQNLGYIDEDISVLRRDLKLKREYRGPVDLLLKDDSAKNALGIHIRKGDYVSNREVGQIHGICSEEYFINALRVFEKAKDIKTIHIFSDDPEFVPDFLRNRRERIVKVSSFGLSDVQEFELMRNFPNLILSNSSYSWWAGFANENPVAKVVAPVPWFDAYPVESTRLIPSYWTRVAKNA